MEKQGFRIYLNKYPASYNSGGHFATDLRINIKIFSH